MLFRTTYKDSVQEALVNDLVGQPFSLLNRINMKGVGSKRLIIANLSPGLFSTLNKIADINYCNIELRPGGIIVRINKSLETFAWVIPYYHLVVYKTSCISIHAQGNFVRFKYNKTFKESKIFFDKLINEKIKHNQQYQLPHPI